VTVTVARKHGPGCSCTRCEGFAASNQLRRTHGGYSMVGLAARAAEIADEIRPTRS
jgi:hypothetical protein